MMCLLALLATGISLKAQEISITLLPGWTWIGYPKAGTMDIATAMGDFVPMENDVIKSQFSFSVYENGQWSGNLHELSQGLGYHYFSNRSYPVTFSFSDSFLPLTVETASPTEITSTSAVVGGTVTLPEGSHVFLRGVCWGTEPNPDIDGNHTSNGAAVGSYSITLEDLTPNITYYVRAYAVSDYGLAYGDVLNFITESGGSDDHEYVDLGLPSGLLWATCNVGADTPEGYGDYFAWGETQPKDTYNWSTYQYCNGSYDQITKYCCQASCGYNGFTDNLTTLLPEDDAATANWGDGWRMPTKAEWEELMNNTTVTWTTQNGVNGRHFTASNGNSLFLPAAGSRWGSELDSAGSCGDYWPSSLYNSNHSWGFFFDSGGCYMGDGGRYRGLSVRAVRSSSQSTSFVINATANPVEGGVVSGGGTYSEGIECTLTATANQGYTFTNWTENGEVVSANATFTFTVTGDRSLVANFAVSGSGNHEYVDLGLPSGTLWATCNVGANSPEDYGNYFAWGETQHKDYYDWSTYQYSNGGDSDNPNLTRYCNYFYYGYEGYSDNLTTLLPEDDAATANWGSAWRMPTYDEWEELYNNTTCTWATQNGVNGRLFTASNGNSLFLPAAGSYLDGELSVTGYWGGYWSSTLGTVNLNSSFAWNYHFNSDNYGMLNEFRIYGYTVRPVRSESQSTSFGINATPNPAECGAVSGGGIYLEGTNCTLTATANQGYTFTNWTENGTVVSTSANYTFTVTSDRNLVANFAVSGSGYHEYVDLGLPSGLLWATCNVGANSPEDYGDYFTWGETVQNVWPNWSTYPYSEGGDYSGAEFINHLTKYCFQSDYGYNGFTDNLMALLSGDDAATANWGSNWRMPTEIEWQELYNNTTNIWTTQNGVYGRMFTAANGNNIFLPAAGYYLMGDIEDASVLGYYWSNSLCHSNPNEAWGFGFTSDFYVMYEGLRCYGLSVRPVRSSH